MASEKLFHVGVKALIVNDRNQILLLKANVANFEDGNKTPHWDIPGGRIQTGQTVGETLEREVQEETGLTGLGKPEFFTAVVSNIQIPVSQTEKVGLMLMVYKVTADLTAEIELSDEHIDYEWVDATEAGRRLAFKFSEDFGRQVSRLSE